MTTQNFASKATIQNARDRKAYGYAVFASKWNEVTKDGHSDYIGQTITCGSTGYFEQYVRAPAFQKVVGAVSAHLDQHGRPVLMVTTPFGNVVLFKRYTDEENFVITTNLPDELRTWVESGNLSCKEDVVYLILGSLPTNNIGYSLSDLRESFKTVGLWDNAKSDQT